MFSVKRLCAHLRLDHQSDALMIQAVLMMPLHRGDRKRVLEDVSPAYELEHDSPSRKLYILNRLLEGFHGVEIIRSRDDTMHEFKGISYLNTGDSYGATIMYDHGKRKWLLSTWGDVVERQERRFQCE